MSESPQAPPRAKVQDTKVEAMVRVRPFSKTELAKLRAEDPNGIAQSIVHMESNGKSVILLDPEKDYRQKERFEFDEAFWSVPESQWGVEGADEYLMEALRAKSSHLHVVDQEEVYQRTGAKVVQHALDGYHSCIFAYGQTGSGKTYTMLGGLNSLGHLSAGANKSERGICIRIIEDLFETMQMHREEPQDSSVNMTVSITFVEIYKEKCKDLLISMDTKRPMARTTAEAEKEYKSVDPAGSGLKVRSDKERGTYIHGAREMKFDNKRKAADASAEVAKIMEYGMRCRHTASTKMNDVSSRSHAMLQISFVQSRGEVGKKTISNINLVDLAGAERLKMSEAEGERANEAKMINLSLSTLRRVIDILIDNAKKGAKQMIPPYRESLLTLLLGESLGGNSKTIMIATVSPYRANFQDTWNTLRYANRAREIVCKARRNEQFGKVLISAMQMKIKRLQAEVEEKEKMQDEVTRAELAKQLKEAEEKHRLAVEEYEQLKLEGEQLKQKYSDLDKELKEKEFEKEELYRKQEETEELRKKRRDLEEQALEAGKKADQLSEQVDRAVVAISKTREEKDQLLKHQQEVRQKERATRLEMQLTKQRQLALAFRNSLQIHRDRKFMETLANQQSTAREKFQQIERQLEEKKRALARVQDEHRHLTMNYELAQQRLEDVNRNYDDSMALLQEKIDNVNQKKQKAEQDLSQFRVEIAKKTEALEEIKADQLREQQEADAMLKQLEDEYSETVRANEQTDKEILEAQSEVAKAKAELQRLRDEHKQLSEQNATAAQDLEQVEKEHQALEGCNSALRLKVADARQQLEQSDQQKQAVESEIGQMNKEIQRIKRSHEDLKTFVSQRFFPSGGIPSSPQDPPQRPAQPSVKKWEPKPTLKTQQQVERIQAQKRANAVGGASQLRSGSAKEAPAAAAPPPSRGGYPPTSAVPGTARSTRARPTAAPASRPAPATARRRSPTGKR